MLSADSVSELPDRRHHDPPLILRVIVGEPDRSAVLSDSRVRDEPRDPDPLPDRRRDDPPVLSEVRVQGPTVPPDR